MGMGHPCVGMVSVGVAQTRVVFESDGGGAADV
jgi:hypothetical protein